MATYTKELINQSELKRMAGLNGKLQITNKFREELNYLVTRLVHSSIDRCKANKRKTLLMRDL